MFFYGILAVGTEEGHLLLVDLALDDDEDLTKNISTESNPCKLHYISATEANAGAGCIADIRQAVMRRGQHLCLPLNDHCYANSGKAFQHKATFFPAEGVVVNSMMYVPQLSSLAVGFNFGAWQLWNLSTLNLEFSSTYEGPDELPITEFTFQEPENDPRNFCYLWTMQSEFDFDTDAEKMSLRSMASISLYALSYEQRDEGDQYGVLYENLTACQKRFRHFLKPEASKEEQVVASLALSCTTLGFGSALPSGMIALTEASDAESVMNNLGLALFLWEVHLANESQPEFYFGLFDLNAWYQAQMPYDVVLEAQGQCPYFSFCALDDVVAAAKGSRFTASGKKTTDDSLVNHLLNVGVDLSTLSRYHSLSNSEQHFYPSSLAFDLTCLFDDGIIMASNLGLQRKVLMELQTEGKTGLVEPQHLYQLCLISGLISSQDPTVSMTNVELEEQRRQLLTVALEHHQVNLLTCCIHHWRDGKYSHSGCTLKFMLDWAWERVTHTKQLIDKQTEQLFDFSCLELDENAKKVLGQHAQHLRHLQRTIQALIRNSGIVYEQGLDELHTKLEVTTLIKQVSVLSQLYSHLIIYISFH